MGNGTSTLKRFVQSESTTTMRNTQNIDHVEFLTGFKLWKFLMKFPYIPKNSLRSCVQLTSKSYDTILIISVFLPPFYISKWLGQIALVELTMVVMRHHHQKPAGEGSIRLTLPHLRSLSSKEDRTGT